VTGQPLVTADNLAAVRAGSVTAAGKTMATMVYGPVAATAPHLATDLAAILESPEPGTTQPQGTMSQGGPNKPA